MLPVVGWSMNTLSATLVQFHPTPMHLVLFSKPGCHLCEGLQEKLEAIQQLGTLDFKLEICDITTRTDWFEAYQYEIPVLFVLPPSGSSLPPTPIPRPSPRASVAQLERVLQPYSE
jgi:Glutaredoxin-like domain (DUF836)